MYCPKCGAGTVENAKYCRSCGADVSLVPLAITGQLGTGVGMEKPGRDASKHLSTAITNSVTAGGFLAVAVCVLLFAPAGSLWWFWMLIPAFALLGSGISEYVRYRHASRASFELPRPSLASPNAPRLGEASFTDKLPPASVTEQTTRSLDVPRDRIEE